MKLDLNKPLVGLDGLPVTVDNTQITMGKILAQVMAGSNSQDSLKFWEWATAFFGGSSVTLDVQDYELLYKFVKENTSLTVASKAQIMSAMINQKDEAKPQGEPVKRALP